MSALPNTTECNCSKCRALCSRNPGWPLPAEARAAIEAGYANRYMRDWLEPDEDIGNTDRIFVIAPAARGYGGSDAPEMELFDFNFKKGRCVFFVKNACELHASGFKPIQCRMALGCRENECPDNYDIARAWNTVEGREVVELWQKEISK